MTPENSDGSNGKNHAKERENISDGVLIFFPLPLSSLIAFDLRTSLESQPAARLLAKKEISHKKLSERWLIISRQ